MLSSSKEIAASVPRAFASWPHITGALSGIDMAILFGDPMQGKMSEPHSGGGPLKDGWRPQDVFLHSTKNTKVMREVNYMTNDNSASWMQKKTSTVDHHHDWETHRYGDKITDFLKDVFRGDVQKNLRPAKTAPKSILVGLRFPKLQWEYEDGEVARCQLLFASIAMLVASEMILYYERRQNMNMDSHPYHWMFVATFKSSESVSSLLSSRLH